MTNVLFMMADELSHWALNGPAHMPNMQRLRARAMAFDAAYTPSPICVPARAALGGADKILKRNMFDHTPADSR